MQELFSTKMVADQESMGSGERNGQTVLSSAINIFTPLSPAKVTAVYDSYWRFAAARQEVFFNRLEAKTFPWCQDSIINTHRFTNVYRAADRVSQYLIRNVIYNPDLPNSPTEILFRILLFKLFNKIDTWKLLSDSLGTLTYEYYNFEAYNKILTEAISSGVTIYSAAYIMPSGQSHFGFPRKHSNHLKLIELILQKNTPERITAVKSMQQVFELLKQFPSLGDFLAYQLTIDLNYSELLNFSESDFVVPGPGAKGGISKCFLSTGGLSQAEVIKLVTDRQEREFERLGLTFQNLWGRRLQLIDCQNIFCEVDKYARVKHPEIKGDSNRVRIKQTYKRNTQPIDFWFPPKWGINSAVAVGCNTKQDIPTPSADA